MNKIKDLALDLYNQFVAEEEQLEIDNQRSLL